MTKRKLFEQKLKDYGNILRSDEDWDYIYVLKLLKYKLERTRKCIVSNNIVVSSKAIGREIERVEKLLGRVINDRYRDEVFAEFDKKYGQLKMISARPTAGSKFVPVSFKYAKETPKTRDRINREAFRLYRKADRMRVRDLNQAFDLMKKNLWGWWD